MPIYKELVPHKEVRRRREQKIDRLSIYKHWRLQSGKISVHIYLFIYLLFLTKLNISLGIKERTDDAMHPSKDQQSDH